MKMKAIVEQLEEGGFEAQHEAVRSMFTRQSAQLRALLNTIEHKVQVIDDQLHYGRTYETHVEPNEAGTMWLEQLIDAIEENL